MSSGYHILNVERTAQNALDFVSSMVTAVREGIVTRGSMVVIDNAPIHVARNALVYVEELFRSVGALLVLLPTYSAELNPCELVFGQVKNRMYRRRGQGSLLQEVALGFQTVSVENVIHFYDKCIFGALDEY